ncbi:hypothetical protein PLANPX_5606 [Lacipirellula parvula]|uniref:Uncharacterized protein n=1 Tax=Lacipirellula parvula TaxID=2650471 RepID=A0A5K7XGH8_9BACT|nr:hypothetical protein PLANPX_5606 [Lacipirellula parvula]
MWNAEYKGERMGRGFSRIRRIDADEEVVRQLKLSFQHSAAANAEDFFNTENTEITERDAESKRRFFFSVSSVLSVFNLFSFV